MVRVNNMNPADTAAAAQKKPLSDLFFQAFRVHGGLRRFYLFSSSVYRDARYNIDSVRGREGGGIEPFRRESHDRIALGQRHI